MPGARPPPRSTSAGSAGLEKRSGASDRCASSFLARRIRSSRPWARPRAGAGCGVRSPSPPMPEIVARLVDEAAFARLVAGGCDPRLARIFAARGIASHEDLATTLKALAAPEGLAHVDDAARLLA